MLKSCDFTGWSCYVNRLCGRLENSESFSCASQACITRTPTAAPRLVGLRGEVQPRSPSVFARTQRAFQKALSPDRKCATAPAAFWNSTFLVWQGESVSGGICMGEVGGFADIGRFELMPGRSHWETVGSSKKVFTEHSRAGSFCKG